MCEDEDFSRVEMCWLQHFMSHLNLEPPNWLDEDAKMHFTEMLRLMDSAAMEIDLSIIADYAQAQSDVERLTAETRFEGEVVTTEKGGFYISPKVTMLMARRKDLMMLRTQLKITPQARQQVLQKPKKGGLRTAMST